MTNFYFPLITRRSLTDLSWLMNPSKEWLPPLTALDTPDEDPSEVKKWTEFYEPNRVEEMPPELFRGEEIPTDSTNSRIVSMRKDGRVFERYQSPYEAERKDRPPIAYNHLIIMAINSSVDKKMTLKEIYAWIQDNFKYYRETRLVRSYDSEHVTMNLKFILGQNFRRDTVQK